MFYIWQILSIQLFHKWILGCGALWNIKCNERPNTGLLHTLHSFVAKKISSICFPFITVDHGSMCVIEVGCTFVLSFGQMNWKICRKLIYLAKIVCKLCCDLKNEIWSYRYCSGSSWTFNNSIFDFDCGSCIFTNHTSILTTAKHIQKNSLKLFTIYYINDEIHWWI